MQIINESSIDTTAKISKNAKYELYEEIPTAVFINGKYTSTVLLAPGNHEEYITGFLFTEQYISKPEEIESIRVEKNRVSVLTTNIFTSPGPKKTILSGCGGAVSYIDPGKLPVITVDYSIHTKDLDVCVNVVLTSVSVSHDSPVFSFLCKGPDILLRRYDLGDDQAIDRMIGAALICKIDFSSSFCICSATITSEVIRKCLMAQIPLILTTGYLTSLAVEIGQKNGMCIAGIRNDKILVYSHPKRITS